MILGFLQNIEFIIIQIIHDVIDHIRVQQSIM